MGAVSLLRAGAAGPHCEPHHELRLVSAHELASNIRGRTSSPAVCRAGARSSARTGMRLARAGCSTDCAA